MNAFLGRRCLFTINESLFKQRWVLPCVQNGRDRCFKHGLNGVQASRMTDGRRLRLRLGLNLLVRLGLRRFVVHRS